MAGLFDMDPTGGGLMGIYANPQMAGLLGLGQGLLASSGASRLPVTMGQALGNGMQGAEQGIGNALQMQRGMYQMQAMQRLAQMQPGAQSQNVPNTQSMPPVSGSANVAGLSGPSAGMGGFAPPTPVSQASAAQQAAGPSIYGYSPQQLFQVGALMNAAGMQGGGDYMRIAVEHDPTLAAQMPTDVTKMGVQAGWNPQQIQQANADAIAKQNALSVRPGGGVMVGNQFNMVPQAVPGYVAMQDPNSPSGWKQVPIGGGLDAISNSTAASAGATARAKAENVNQQVWDPTANNGQGGFVFQTQAQVNDASNGVGGAQPPVGIRNNNFGAIKTADGKQFMNYPTVQDGINAADNNLLAYGAKHGINTITGIANRWSPVGDGNNNPTAKAAAISAASGIPVDQPINLTDPAVRSRILPALFDTETPGWRNAAGGNGAPAQQPAPQKGGPMAAQPPQGSAAMSNEAQAASAKVMADDYQNMQGVRQNAPAVLQAYDHMIDLAKTGGITGWAANGGALGKLMSTEAATYASPTAAEYDKTRAFLINAGGAAMGEHNTDAARANLDRMIPEFGKPTQAKLDGLYQGRNQVSMAALRANMATQLFTAGNSKDYTTLANQFDTTVKPEMMPVIEPVLQQSGALQHAMVSAIVNGNPSMKPAFETLYKAGMLK